MSHSFVLYNKTAFAQINDVEWGELGHWCELGQKFSESSSL